MSSVQHSVQQFGRLGKEKQSERVDPIMLALERESKGFDPSLYIESGNLAVPE